MASRLSITEEDFYCPICCDIFRDPIILSCSHSICNGCVKTFWNRRETQECPICRAVSTNPNPPINIVLRNMCDLMREETTQEPPVEMVEFCSLHGEPLTFFCTEDQEVVCGKCRNVKSHRNHRIHLTADASPDTDEHFHQLPANPERFDGYTSILGSEGFNSGTHCWDIDVGDSTAWAVGVITESTYKHRQTSSKTGLWYVGFCNGKYGKGCSPEILTHLRVTQRIQRIRVQLDWDKGKVTFTDLGHNIGLHMFKHTFTERVFPYFYSHCMKHRMRIIEIKTAVEAHV